jgi:hypothetical protein
MNNKLEAKVKRDNSLATFLGDNATAYAGDTAFEAAAAAEVNNTGYSYKKVIAKDDASVLASQLCGNSQVSLDLSGNFIVSKSLNPNVSFYSHASDVTSAARLQNAHDIMSTNVSIITPEYVTPAQLTTLQTKINTFTGLSGTTTSVNSTSPILTKAVSDDAKIGAADVIVLKKLGKKYQITNPTFYSGLEKVCKIPPITVRHTPVNITITDSVTLALLPGVKGTLSKTKELGSSTSAGIMAYTDVSAGLAISTYKLVGYITGVQNVRIKRGVANTFAFALVAGVMTAEMEAAIEVRINAFNVAEEAKKAAKAIKEKARKDAKAAKKNI